MKHVLLTVLALASFHMAQAQEVQFGEMGFGGTGCPAGKAPVLKIVGRSGRLTIPALAIDSRSQDALFVRQNCSVRLPVTVEAGYQIKVRSSEVSGSIAQESGISTTIESKAGFVGVQAAQPTAGAYNAKVKGKFKIKATSANTLVASNCEGKDSILTIDSNLLARLSRSGQSVQASVKEVKLDFIVSACK